MSVLPVEYPVDAMRSTHSVRGGRRLGTQLKNQLEIVTANNSTNLSIAKQRKGNNEVFLGVKNLE